MTEGTDKQGASAPVHAFVHTPGPWKVRARFDVVQDLGIYGGYFVGSTRGNSSDLPANVQAQDEANARLISAAPELAEALRILYDFQNGPPLEKYRGQWNDAMKLAKAALAKAGSL